MQFSIKPPGAFLWKTGYTEVKIRSCLQGGRITGDWLVCPLGEAARAVTVTEFIDNPSILNELNDVPSERSSDFAEEPQTPLSVAALGWWVFLGALTAHFIVATILTNRAAGLTRSMDTAVFATTLLKGIDALVIAGAITALFGHAYKKTTKAEQVEPRNRH
jgi:hypothetical protein